MVTVEQIKAGRALLGWSQKVLAKRAGYALPTLNNIERGLTSPRHDTLSDIKTALEQGGVQFLDKTGVRLVKEILDIEMLEGRDCIKILYDDLFETVNADGGEILLANIQEDKFLEFDPNSLMRHLQRTGNRSDIHHKLLFKHGDTNVLRPELFVDVDLDHIRPNAKYSQWRWLPESLFGLAPMIIYGDKYAMILWGEHVRVVITHNPSITETFRKQFMALWEGAEKIPEDLLPH